MTNKTKDSAVKRQLIKVEGFFKELVTVHDSEGRVLKRLVNPLMLEFRLRDVIQVMVGSMLLATPVAFTEEVWNLGQQLPLMNVLFLALLSLSIIAVFVYYNYYARHFEHTQDEFVKRVLGIYFISLVVVAVFLTLIQRAPWSADLLLTIKRVIIVAVPASMSAAVVDTLK